MVGEIATRHALSEEMIDGVSERTGGVPLFVEEVTRLLLERGVQGGAQAIPPTLQQSLAARLDRLGGARGRADRRGAGARFSYRLLSDVSSTPPDRRAAPASRAGSAHGSRHPVRRGRPSDRRLPLQARADPGRGLREPTQEPPTGAAPPRRRNSCATAERAAEPEAIAHHFTQAGLDDLAIEWWGKAGDQALAPLGLPGGDRPSRQGDRDGGQGGRERRQRHRRLGRSERTTDAIAVGLRQRALRCAGLRAPRKRRKLSQGPASRRLATRMRPNDWRPTRAVGRQLRARRVAIGARGGWAFLSDVEARPDSPEAGVAHRAAGQTCWFAGEYREARDHFERALALFQPGRDDDLAFRFGLDPGVAAMANLATRRGLSARSIARLRSLTTACRRGSRASHHVGTLAHAMIARGMFELMRGDLRAPLQNASESPAWTLEHELRMYARVAVFLEGWATVATRRAADGLARHAPRRRLLREQNVLKFDGLLKIALAEAEARAGDPDRA